MDGSGDRDRIYALLARAQWRSGRPAVLPSEVPFAVWASALARLAAAHNLTVNIDLGADGRITATPMEAESGRELLGRDFLILDGRDF